MTCVATFAICEIWKGGCIEVVENSEAHMKIGNRCVMTC